MNIFVTVTKKNTTKYPLHFHKQWELMCYTAGNGLLKTEIGDFEFSEDTVIAVPPQVKHGSQSDYEFRNICVYMDFDISVYNNEIIYIKTGTHEQTELFKMISHYYFEIYNESIIVNLANALISMIFTTEEFSKNALIQVRRVISDNFSNADFSIKDTIANSGYADDYFRTLFKQKYEITPLKYLISLRMNYAKYLLSSYRNTLKLYEIAKLCGYKDSLYFSRSFKKYFGVAPSDYIISKEKKL